MTFRSKNPSLSMILALRDHQFIDYFPLPCLMTAGKCCWPAPARCAHTTEYAPVPLQRNPSGSSFAPQDIDPRFMKVFHKEFQPATSKSCGSSSLQRGSNRCTLLQSAHPRRSWQSDGNMSMKRMILFWSIYRAE